MNPEKQIVLWWLARRGFFCASSLRAGKNREVGILAMKVKAGKAEEVLHVELAVSVSGSGPVSLKEYQEKFTNKSVRKAVKDFLKGKVQAEPKAMLITNSSKAKALENVEVVPFSHVLAETIGMLDTQFYAEPVIRTLQLVKNDGLSPETLAKVVTGSEGKRGLSYQAKEQLLAQLLTDKEAVKALAKRQHEGKLLELLKHSTLNRPERLAKVIDTEVLGKRSRKRFLNALLDLEGVKKEIKKQLHKSQRTLKFFSK